MDATRCEELFRTWAHESLGTLLKVARAFAPSPADREELLQDLLSTLWEALPEPELPGAPEDDSRERLALLYEAIHALVPLDRTLVLLSLDGLPYSEIAEVTGLTENPIGVRLTRARQRLKDSLSAEAMTMDQLEAVWSTQEKHAALAVQRFAVDELLQGLRRRQRLRVVALVYVLLAGLGTLGLAGYVAAARLAGDLVSLAVLTLLLVPLLVLIFSRVRAYTEEWREARRLEASVAAATRASLAAVDSELRAARHLHLAQLFTAAVLPLALWREHTLGLASPSHLLAQALLFTGMLALAAGVLRYRTVRILRPRRERLRSLLEALESPSQGISLTRAKPTK